MIARFIRTIYRELPEGQEWMLGEVDGKEVIIVNAALDEAGRKAARKAARASLRGGRHLGWMPLSALLAVIEWLRRRAHNPMGAAMMASIVTATAVYAITAESEPRRVADPPPAIITMAPSLTASSTVPTTSPAPTTDRATPADRPSRRSQPTARPARTWEPPPPRTQAPRTRSARPSPKRAPDEEAAPERTRRSATPTANSPTTDATAATPELISDGGDDPPGPQPTPPPMADDDPPAIDDPPGLDAQPTLAGDRACGGIHVGVPLDPLLNVDVCLLD